MVHSNAQPLFRQEVIEAKRCNWVGTIQLSRPLSTKIISVVAALVAVAVLMVLILGRYTRREHVSGQLVPANGLLPVVTLNAGILTRLLVQQGSEVHKGEILAEVSSETSSSAFGDTQAFIREQLRAESGRLSSDLDFQRRLADADQKGQHDHLQNIDGQLKEIDAQLAVQRRQADSARELFDRIAPLKDKGYVSAVQIQQEEATALSAQEQLEALKRERQGLVQQLEETRKNIELIPLNLAEKENEIQRSVAEIERQSAQIEAQRSVILSATSDGIVSTVVAHQGETVAAGQTLLTIVPAGSELQAELLVPSRGAGLVRKGDPVVLRYHAYPYQKFGVYRGTVRDVSLSALTPSEIVALGLQSGEPLYRVEVKLETSEVISSGRRDSLKAGLALDADILQERRRLLEWVFEPLIGLHRSIAMDPATND